MITSHFCLQERCKIDGDQLFLVTFEALRPLFNKCREPGCECYVHEADLNIVVKGAGLRVSALCSENHLTRWESAEFINGVSLSFFYVRYQYHTSLMLIN
jgi:hypothetical protein